MKNCGSNNETDTTTNKNDKLYKTKMLSGKVIKDPKEILENVSFWLSLSSWPASASTEEMSKYYVLSFNPLFAESRAFMCPYWLMMLVCRCSSVNASLVVWCLYKGHHSFVTLP